MEHNSVQKSILILHFLSLQSLAGNMAANLLLKEGISDADIGE